MIIREEICKALSDHEIIEKSLEDLDFFSCLYMRYEHELLRYIRRISGIDEEEAKDILQDAFIKIWRKLNEFDSELKFSSWIYRIVHNETLSHIRKRKSYGKDKKSDPELLKEKLKDESGTDSDPDELALVTHEILESLPLKYREILVLKFFEKKSYEEISDILMIPEGTVAVRINRAKKMFRGMAEIQKIFETE